MSLFYYLPHRRPSQCRPDDLSRLGLAYAFQRKPAARECSRGPANAPGVILAEEENAGYFPERQTWRRIPAALIAAGQVDQEVWVGRSNDHRPAPEQLARAQQLDGHWVELADGQKWLVPAAVAIDEDADQLRKLSRLPAASSLGEDGRWQLAGVAAPYAALWKTAQEFWTAFVAGQIGEDNKLAFDFDGLHSRAVDALAVNYRLGPAECDLLGLLDESTTAQILRAVIDWPTVERWAQKKTASAPDGGDSPLGPADETSIIDPP